MRSPDWMSYLALRLSCLAFLFSINVRLAIFCVPFSFPLSCVPINSPSKFCVQKSMSMVQHAGNSISMGLIYQKVQAGKHSIKKAIEQKFRMEF